MVYVVRCSSGQYEEYREWISGIFTDIELAENLRTKISGSVYSRINAPCIIDGIDIETFDDISKLGEEPTKEQLDKFNEWWWDKTYAQEFNGCWIDIYELNKVVDQG